MIVIELGLKCKQYNENIAEVFFCFMKQMEQLTIVCPKCLSKLFRNDEYQRGVIDEDGVHEQTVIMQTMCTKCGTTHALLPDFIRPYKHYGAAVIELALTTIEETGGFSISSCPADDSTIRRWAVEFRERARIAEAQLLAILYELYQRHLSILAMQERSQLKRLVRLLRELNIEPKENGVISCVNTLITRNGKGYV